MKSKSLPHWKPLEPFGSHSQPTIIAQPPTPMSANNLTPASKPISLSLPTVLVDDGVRTQGSISWKRLSSLSGCCGTAGMIQRLARLIFLFLNKIAIACLYKKKKKKKSYLYSVSGQIKGRESLIIGHSTNKNNGSKKSKIQLLIERKSKIPIITMFMYKVYRIKSIAWIRGNLPVTCLSSD